jgi:hypothetical protein
MQQQLIAIPQQRPGTDDFYTPPEVFEALGLEFDLDVCAPPGGVRWVPAKRFFTVEDDGLAQPWEGRVWMNPPFSKPSPWIDRFIEHGNGVCLVPASNGGWFHTLWAAADAIVLPTVRAMVFVGGGIPIRCVLAAFGDENVEALRHLGVIRSAA